MAEERAPRQVEGGAGRPRGAPPLPAAHAPSLPRCRRAERRAARAARRGAQRRRRAARRARGAPTGRLRAALLPGTPPTRAAPTGRAAMEVDGGGGGGGGVEGVAAAARAGGEGGGASPFEADAGACRAAATPRRRGGRRAGPPRCTRCCTRVPPRRRSPPPLYLQLGLELSRCPRPRRRQPRSAPRHRRRRRCCRRRCCRAGSGGGRRRRATWWRGRHGARRGASCTLASLSVAPPRRLASPRWCFGRRVWWRSRSPPSKRRRRRRRRKGGRGEPTTSLRWTSAAATARVAARWRLPATARVAARGGCAGRQPRPLTVEQVLRAFWAALLRQGATAGGVKGSGAPAPAVAWSSWHGRWAGRRRRRGRAAA